MVTGFNNFINGIIECIDVGGFMLWSWEG